MATVTVTVVNAFSDQGLEGPPEGMVLGADALTSMLAPRYKKYVSALFLAGTMTLLSGPCKAAPGANCPPPERDARRYELDGTTTLRYAVGADGKVMSATVQRSSGWKTLDNAALSNLSRCVFPEPTPEGEAKPIQYLWRLDGEPSLRPLLVQGSCQESERFQTFKNLDKFPSNASGVVLRMLINSEGAPWRVVAEAPGLSPELVDAAIAFVQSCRFAIDPDVPGTRTDSTYGRLLLKNW